MSWHVVSNHVVSFRFVPGEEREHSAGAVDFVTDVTSGGGEDGVHGERDDRQEHKEVDHNKKAGREDGKGRRIE